MPREKYERIGGSSLIVKVGINAICNSCLRGIPVGESVLRVDDPFDDPTTFICKDCIKLAAKRLGVMR